MEVCARSGALVDADVGRKLHQTFRKFGDGAARLSYNAAAAAMTQFMSTVRTGERKPRAEGVRPLVQVVSPYAPHVAEEL